MVSKKYLCEEFEEVGREKKFEQIEKFSLSYRDLRDAKIALQNWSFILEKPEAPVSGARELQVVTSTEPHLGRQLQDTPIVRSLSLLAWHIFLRD
jgi:hypothetical protein